MPRFLFLTWNGAGNQPPAVAIAQALKKRGHQITFAGYENQRSYFTEHGFRFVLLGRSSAAWRDEPPERMFAVKLRAAWASSDHLLDVPRLISQEQSDAIIVDCLMFGALAAAEKVHVPTVALVHSAPGALMPPKGRFESQVLDPANDVRLHAGLPAVASLWEAWAHFPSLSNSIRQLDPLASQAPASFSYLGPMAEELQPSVWKTPWSADDRRPLVLVSFSTGPYWDQSSRILRTLDAICGHDCRALVTTGSVELDPRTVPDNAVVARRVPHEEVLPHVAVTVTHAGHGTVVASLKHGVPLLCLPNPAADQPILASQIRDLGCGLSLDGDNAMSCEIREAIDRLMSEPSYAANARLLADAISKSPGVSAAVSRLEHLCMQTGDGPRITLSHVGGAPGRPELQCVSRQNATEDRMSETATAASKRKPRVEPTVCGSTYVRPQDLAWEPTQFPGISIKVLYEDKAKGEMTCLLKWKPGATLPMHKHPEIEQSYVIEGSFSDHDGICRAGEFVWRRIGSFHETYSAEGAVILAVYRKPNVFQNGAGYERRR